MPVPGPTPLGRSIVVAAGDPAPPAWTDSPRTRIDEGLLGDSARLSATVATLHEAWVARTPQVIELAVPPARLSTPETTQVPPWELGGEFTFPLERLRFLVWVNAYNALDGDPSWRWAAEATALGCTPSPVADVTLPDGRAAWIDGGPRGPIADISEPVVHFETVSLGRLTPTPPSAAPTDPLAPDQLAAVTHGVGGARVIAPAGSGKTRTLTARIQHLRARGVEPEILSAVAYNTRAAREMAERIDDSSVWIRTIHSLGRAILIEALGDVRQLEERDVRTHLDRMVRLARRPNTDTIGPYIEALSEVRIALRAPDEVEAERDDVPEFASVYRRYRAELQRRQEADFDELIFGAIEALLADPALRRSWQARCRHLLVDEFQDLTPAYLLLLRLVASPALNVFGVGDDDQVIYGYAGADPAFLIDYPRLFPGAGSHALGINYRCPAPVVEAAARLLTHNRRRIAKTITAGPDAHDATDALVVTQIPGPELAVEAARVITQWVDEGNDPASIAVLCRVNSALLPVHVALAELGTGFVSSLNTGVLRRTVTSATLAWMRLGMMPDDLTRTDLLAAVTRPSRGLNRLARQLLTARHYPGIAAVREVGTVLSGRQATRWQEFCDDLTTVSRAARTGDAGSILDTVIDGVGLAGSASVFDGKRSHADRSSHSDDLVALRRAAAIHPDADTFEAWLHTMLATPDVDGGVLLTTIHRVKGLEWDRVIIFGADRGLMPHTLAADLEEERRVFHVALTRARRQAVVLADRDRPSRFLAEMRTAAVPGQEPTEERTPTKRISGPTVSAGDEVRVAGGHRGTVVGIEAGRVSVRLEAGARLSVPLAEVTPVRVAAFEDVDPVLVEHLKAWRLETARAQNVPAYVVFNDATLMEIASRRPASLEELADVKGIGPSKLEAYGDDILSLLE